MEYHAFGPQALPHSKQLDVKIQIPLLYLPTSLPIQVWFPTDVLQLGINQSWLWKCQQSQTHQWFPSVLPRPPKYWPHQQGMQNLRSYPRLADLCGEVVDTHLSSNKTYKSSGKHLSLKNPSNINSLLSMTLSGCSAHGH